jgi:hypothetical protein
MNRWLLLATKSDEGETSLPDTRQKPAESLFRTVSAGCQVEDPPPESAAPVAGPAPSRDAADPFRHGRSVTGAPRTWTGRVVSLDDWRRLSAWERHGPDGRLFCGACRAWVMPGGCRHCGRGAA